MDSVGRKEWCSDIGFHYICAILPWEEFVPFEHSAIASKQCRSPSHGHHQRTSLLF